MHPKTLFETAEPIVRSLNFYGCSFDEPEGCWRRSCKWLMRVLLIGSVLLFLKGFDVRNPRTYMGVVLMIRMALLGTYCYLRAIFNNNSLKGLIHRMKLFKVEKSSANDLSKYLKCYEIIVYVTVAIVTVANVATRAVWVKESVDKMAMAELLFWLACSFAWLFVFMALVFFPVLLSSLACLLVIHCASHLRDVIRKTKETRSPLRRATMYRKLTREYYRVKGLAEMTNDRMSTLLLIFKLLISFYFGVVSYDEKRPFRNLEYALGFAFISYFLLIFIIYMTKAAIVNQMPSLISKCLMEMLLNEDEWNSRDVKSNPTLIKVMFDNYSTLVQILMVEGALTIAGKVIDGECLFTTLLEIYDLRNTLAIYDVEEKVPLTSLILCKNSQDYHSTSECEKYVQLKQLFKTLN